MTDIETGKVCTHWNLSCLEIWSPPFGVWINFENERTPGERCSQQPVIATGPISEAVLAHW